MNDPEAVTLLLGGDVMTGRGIDQALARPLPPRLKEPCVRDARTYLRLAARASGAIGIPVREDHVWGDALGEMQDLAPDRRVANLETAITRSTRLWPDKAVHYRMSPAHVGCLTAARLDALSLANNHVLDGGRRGLIDTLQALDRAGVAHAGAGADLASARAPAVLALPGGRRLLMFAWAGPDCGVPAGWAAGRQRAGIALLARLDEAAAREIARTVQRVRRVDDRVLVSLHWGGNWVDEVPLAHRVFAHRLIELEAADLVHGHSAHHPLPFEVHRGRLILYGCGDLVNDYEGLGPHRHFCSDVACLYAARLQADTGQLVGLDIRVLQRRRLRLGPVQPEAFEWLLGLLVPGCEALGTTLAVRPPNRLAWAPPTEAGDEGPAF